MSDALQALFRSRKFLVAVGDAVVASILFFGAKYLAPAYPGLMEDVKFLIGVLQVPAGLILAAICVEDAASKFRG